MVSGGPSSLKSSGVMINDFSKPVVVSSRTFLAKEMGESL